MRSATIRRFALVAAMVMLAPLWCRPAAVISTLETSGALIVGVADAGATTAPAIRRQVTTGWWAAASRANQVRNLLVDGTLALLALFGVVLWARLVIRPGARSPLVRRRHIIALRAPPLPFCVPQ